MIKVITNRHPTFLKAAYSCCDIDLVNHAGFIDPLEKYIEWDGKDWILQLMTVERAPRFLKRNRTIQAAIASQ